MIKNYFKIAWRNILRNKVNSGINIAGLAIGIACVIMITLYIQDELKFDRFFSKADHIYQVNLDGNFGGQQFYTSGTPPPVGIAMQKEFSEIKAYTRMYALGNQIVSNDAGSKTQNHFTEKRLFGVDSNYLQVFDYGVKEGNAATCLLSPHSVVITEEMAKRYFGNEESIGKTLVLDQYKQPFTVTAVLYNPPSQSTFRFNMLVPMADCPMVKQFSWSWVWGQVNTYVVLNDNITDGAKTVAQLEKKFPAMVRVQAASAFKRIGQPLDELYKKGGKWDFHLQPITDVHLHSANIGTTNITLGDIKYVYIFSVIALFIIVLACVNFMNLSTAQSAIRAKEVGIRKVLGSVRGQLIKQFFTEAMLFSFISALCAIALVVLFLPSFNQVSGKVIRFADVFSGSTCVFVVALAIITGLLAGSYPAFYLTSFSPVSVLKGVGLFKKGGGNNVMRNGLVVFQFAVSIGLIICTIVVFQQLKFAQNKDLGLKKENVVILPNAQKMNPGEEETFRQEVSKIQGVTNATISSDVPGINFNGFTDFYVPISTDVKEKLAKDVTLTSFVVDEYFVPSLKMQLLQGRNFSKEYDDSTSVIVNETTVKQIGWKQPIGKYINYPGGDDQKFKVIGVVKDFDVQSLRSTVTPFALFHVSSKTNQLATSYVMLSLSTATLTQSMQLLESKWKQFLPAVPFEYSFLDKDYEALYHADVQMGTVFGIFTGFSILVACLGLFGLSIYTAERRTKEIGVRKVLGASVQGIVTLLSKDFLKLVFISAIVAFPVAWWAMSKWLQDFVYRIQIQWWVFALAGLLALVIALVTISFQAIKAALMNPVKSLRSE